MKKKLLTQFVTLFLFTNPAFAEDAASQRTTPNVYVVTKKSSTTDSPGQGLDLGQLFRYYGSDKDVNGYTSVYHTLFEPLKEKSITVLEIGIGTMLPNVHSSMVGYAQSGYKPGGSLRAWRDYFINGTILGIDIQPDTQFSDEPRISTYLCDSTNKEAVETFIKKIGNIKFDIIIDDGSHTDSNQLKTLSAFYPHLKDKGIYIIEDIYPQSTVSKNPKTVSKLCNEDPLFFVGLHNNIAVIYKNHLVREKPEYIF